MGTAISEMEALTMDIENGASRYALKQEVGRYFRMQNEHM
jgi:hypothetical protein